MSQLMWPPSEGAEIEMRLTCRVRYIPHGGISPTRDDPGEKPWVEVLDVFLTDQGEEDLADAVARV